MDHHSEGNKRRRLDDGNETDKTMMEDERNSQFHVGGQPEERREEQETRTEEGWKRKEGRKAGRKVETNKG